MQGQACWASWQQPSVSRIATCSERSPSSRQLRRSFALLPTRPWSSFGFSSGVPSSLSRGPSRFPWPSSGSSRSQKGYGRGSSSMYKSWRSFCLRFPWPRRRPSMRPWSACGWRRCRKSRPWCGVPSSAVAGLMASQRMWATCCETLQRSRLDGAKAPWKWTPAMGWRLLSPWGSLAGSEHWPSCVFEFIPAPSCPASGRSRPRVASSTEPSTPQRTRSPSYALSIGQCTPRSSGT
mmetsp:Transcript_59066/g.138389  ORF Transcript_59066/g.138389 Transcript_59066/m.138389 type:complete len:236 (+) Transcript_59066:110-817(+)